MGDLVPILVIGIITWGIYRLFELFVRRKERMLIIEKISERLNPDDVQRSFEYPLYNLLNSGKKRQPFSTLKIALLLMGIGLGLVVSYLIQINTIDIMAVDYENWQLRRKTEEIVFLLNASGITIFGGLGLLIAYLIESRKTSNE